MTDPVILPGFEGFEGVELVQKLPLFRTLTFDETRTLFAIARRERRAAGAVIIDEDALGDALYIVREGSVRITRRGVDIGVRGAGELLGEMSLVDDVLTSARVCAESACELLVIQRGSFDELMQRDLPLALKVYRAFCRTLADRLRRTTDLLPKNDKLAAGVC
ncbi:MAG: cyclic nucleotide-binding domain-containing protein [Deltaproteobacteria bacterium]|nr:cyclic nucleotide-binding domain-containing protein [Deltaproteobacteria bacterium]